MTQISSKGTFYLKTIFPFGVFISTPFNIYLSLTNDFSIVDIFMILIFNAVLLIFAFYALKLKNVFWHSDYLMVRSWNREIKIEKWEISKISDNYIGRPNFVTIYLKWETDFGKVIRFIPSGGFFRFWPNKIVKYLNEWAIER